MWHNREIQSTEESCERQMKYMEKQRKQFLRGKTLINLSSELGIDQGFCPVRGVVSK